MCDTCAKYWSTDKKHDAIDCPMRQALFCSVCQIYGHATLLCPDKETWVTRSPEFVEQLIPPAIRSQYKITSCTPLTASCASPVVQANVAVIEVPVDKDGKYDRATLSSLGIPSSTVKDNKHKLEAYAAAVGKKIVYLQNEETVAIEQAKKVAKNKKRAEGKQVSKATN